jgi:hypothetical protein
MRELAEVLTIIHIIRTGDCFVAWFRYAEKHGYSTTRSSRKDSFEKNIAFGVLRDLAMTSQTSLNGIILPTGKCFVNDGNQ